METERDYYGESKTYLKELRARFQDQPEKLSRFYKVMADIRAQRDEHSGRLKNVPDDVLARVKAILEGHFDLVRGFNLFLPASLRFSVDDDDEAAEAEEEEKEKTAAASAEKTIPLPGFEDAKDFVEKLRTRGGMVLKDFVNVLPQIKDRRDLYKVVVPLCGDDTDLLDGFYRFMRASEATSLASHAPDSQDKDVNNRGAEIIKADEQQQKQPENIKVGQGNDMERKIVKKAGGFAVKAGGKVLIEKLLQDGLCFFENVRKKLSCKISYYTFLKLFFYYTNGKIGKVEWKERIAAVIGKHPDLMDEFWRYVTDCENVQVFRKKVEVEEEDEMQKIETRGCKQRDRKRGKHLYKSIEELDLSQCKRCTPSYVYLTKDYQVPYKHNIMEPELQELNYQFLLVPSVTEDFSTGNNNENKQILFECEDDRYEMDMLIGWFISAVEYAGELEKGDADNNEIKKGDRNIFLRCIERLYDDQGLEMLHIFNEDPQHALPVLKVRLEQKLKELKDYQDELRKVFQEARN